MFDGITDMYGECKEELRILRRLLKGKYVLCKRKYLDCLIRRLSPDEIKAIKERIKYLKNALKCNV